MPTNASINHCGHESNDFRNNRTNHNTLSPWKHQPALKVSVVSGLQLLWLMFIAMGTPQKSLSQMDCIRCGSNSCEMCVQPTTSLTPNIAIWSSSRYVPCSLEYTNAVSIATDKYDVTGFNGSTARFSKSGSNGMTSQVRIRGPN